MSLKRDNCVVLTSLNESDSLSRIILGARRRYMPDPAVKLSVVLVHHWSSARNHYFRILSRHPRSHARRVMDSTPTPRAASAL